MWENGEIIDLNTLIPSNSNLQLVFALRITERGEIAGLGVPPGVLVQDTETLGHAFLLIPDGDCVSACEGRIVASHNNAAPAQNPAMMKQDGESGLS